jgi:hypothetical protein
MRLKVYYAQQREKTKRIVESVNMVSKHKKPSAKALMVL